ncbi:metallophosphoesterase family protein [Kordia sp.]|uniref:metallophosphoesterase family protein n=1 Tax=Kordia sp. TaxID=1965332 RepID=UPI003B5BC89D
MNSKVAYITDIHLDEKFPLEQGIDARKNWNVILKDLKIRNIRSVIFGGDIGEKSSNSYFFDSLKSFDLTISLGNHDDFNEASKYYFSEKFTHQKALYYTQETSVYKCIYLDSSQNKIDDIQYDWFLNELKTDKKLIVFIHHPILGIHTEVDRKYYLIHRDRLRTALEQLSNEVFLFSGHYHFNHVQKHKNITQYVTQAASYQIENIPEGIEIQTETFGYRILDFTPTEIQTTLITFPSQ